MPAFPGSPGSRSLLFSSYDVLWQVFQARRQALQVSRLLVWQKAKTREAEHPDHRSQEQLLTQVLCLPGWLWPRRVFLYGCERGWFLLHGRLAHQPSQAQ